MFKRFWESIFGKKVGNTRVIPVTLKIVITFTVFILVSNLTSNYINLSYNLSELVSQMKQLLVKDLKGMNDFCNNQYEIYHLNGDFEGSIKSIENKSRSEFKKKKSLALGINPDGTFLFEASAFTNKFGKLADANAIAIMLRNHANNKLSASLTIDFNDEKYIAVYRYNAKWNIYLLRAEEVEEFNSISRRIFWNVSVVIFIITLISAILGIFVLRFLLRYIHKITNAIMEMSQTQQLELINIDKASGDDVTFLGASFNSLSSTINNLVTIFRKFATRDVARKAYEDKHIELEGTQKELTILFSDIKGFTFITETLGIDIIKLLNLHYDNAIKVILHRHGIIGSIIGDAILAVYGTVDSYDENKSHLALLSAYELQKVAANIRMKMHAVKEKIVSEHGAMTEAEEDVYKAVLLEIGVGIDGGKVFYGNIGSTERMTNTVIGDNVNSSSRLEGLTRIYKVPVICSEFIKMDIEKNVSNHRFTFVELDIVQVKGKTIGKKIYWPIPEDSYTEELQKELILFADGLKLYYEGDWPKAFIKFKKCKLPLTKVFEDRTENNKCPKDWEGVWAMKTK